MTTSKKGAIIFLWILNILNVLAGFISQFEILLGKDITSIIPINSPLLLSSMPQRKSNPFSAWFL